MTAPDPDLGSRLDRLAARLDRIEQHLHLPPIGPGQESPASSAASRAETPLSSPPSVSGAAASREMQRESLTPPVARPPLTPPHAPPLAPSYGRSGSAPSRPASPPVVAAPAKPARVTLERLVGERLFLALGALIVMVGVALLVKLGYDAGWFRPSPLVKCLIGAGISVALLILGEWARRKVNAFAAAGVSAAGLGGLYASITAAHLLYHLLSPTPTLALLVALTALSVVLALRLNHVAIAVLGFIGAYAAPFILEVPEPSPYFMPVYLIVLQLGGLASHAIRPKRFLPLRTFTWCVTLVLGGLLALDQGADHPVIYLVFLAAQAVIVHAELVYAAARHRLGDMPMFGPEDAGKPRSLSPASARALVVSLVTTAWAVGNGVVIADAAPGLGVKDWYITAVALVAAIFGSLVLCSHLRVLRDDPRTDSERLGVVFLAQAAWLLIATVALALSGWLEAVAWLGLAFGAIFAARWLRVGSVLVFSFVVLAIATARLLFYDAIVGPASVFMLSPLSDLMGVIVSRWMLLILAATAGWLAFAVSIRPVVQGRDVAYPVHAFATFAAVVGVFLLFVAFVNPDMEPKSLVTVWTLLCPAVVFSSMRLRQVHLETIGLAAFLIPALAWAGVYPGSDWNRFKSPLVLHPGLWSALLLVAAITPSMLWVRRALPHTHAANVLRRVMVVASCVLIGAMLLVATSFEVQRGAAMFAKDATARQAALSIWWGLFAVALIAVGFTFRRPLVRHAGLALFTIATAKAVILDLADVSPGWRVASFLGLGLMMLAVAVAYARLAALLSPRASPRPAPELDPSGEVSSIV